MSVLDVCGPEDVEHGSNGRTHRGLAHFLLDGHHKIEAASAAGKRLRLLTLLAVDASLASKRELKSLVQALAT